MKNSDWISIIIFFITVQVVSFFLYSDITKSLISSIVMTVLFALLKFYSNRTQKNLGLH